MLNSTITTCVNNDLTFKEIKERLNNLECTVYNGAVSNTVCFDNCDGETWRNYIDEHGGGGCTDCLDICYCGIETCGGWAGDGRLYFCSNKGHDRAPFLCFASCLCKNNVLDTCSIFYLGYSYLQFTSNAPNRCEYSSIVSDYHEGTKLCACDGNTMNCLQVDKYGADVFSFDGSTTCARAHFDKSQFWVCNTSNSSLSCFVTKDDGILISTYDCDSSITTCWKFCTDGHLYKNGVCIL